jgi:hypothetical protein
MPPSKGPLKYTTEIDPTKTAGECFTMLARYGASRVMIMFDDQRNPSGLAFEIATRTGVQQYQVPVNAEGTYKKLEEGRRAGNVPPRYVTREQATRVAWRVLQQWMEAQLALVETGLSHLDQVMFAWQMVSIGSTETVYDAYNGGTLALTSGQ